MTAIILQFPPRGPWRVEVRREADGGGWLVLARKHAWLHLIDIGRPTTTARGGFRANRKEGAMPIMSNEEREAWLAIRKEAGRHIDPETAEVFWHWADVCDPYGIYRPHPEEYVECIGREYFYRAPGSDIWVNTRDLPETTREALKTRGVPEPSFSHGAP